MKLNSGIALFVLFVCFSLTPVFSQTTEFTYQGSLKDGANPATGNYDFEFALFDSLGAGSQIGSTLTRSTVAVAGGVFTVSLDFGGTQFPGANRFLEIRVRTTGGGAFTLLAPRQQVNSSPYSVKSLAATNAANALQLGGVNAGQYVVTTDPRMADNRAPTAGSANYVQNTTSPQASSNFNVSGTGSANIFNAGTQFNIGGSRVLSVPATDNTFVGLGIGQSNTGIRNAFFGTSAGAMNTTGGANSFFGWRAGQGNLGGLNNSYFGAEAGTSNFSANGNSFFGKAAGFQNGGSNNTFIGINAGALNGLSGNNTFVGAFAGSGSTGLNNSFFGRDAGESNTGNGNTFVGVVAGSYNISGSENSFFGQDSGSTNTTGSHNTLVGVLADVEVDNLTYATAVGSNAVVTASSRIQLGRDGSDTVRIGTLAGATANSLCITNNNVLAACSSSSRYKENIRPFTGSLNLVNQMRPVTFDWKGRAEPDLGLVADDVAEIDPLLVTYDREGKIQGIKYDRIGVVLINAVKEQQAQISGQHKQISSQQSQIEAQDAKIKSLEMQVEAFKALVCSQNPSAEVCRARN